MLRRLLSIFSGLALLVALAIPGSLALAKQDDGEPKVTICHQAGNSGNWVLLEVDESALQAFLNQGDTLGECAPVVEEPPVDEGGGDEGGDEGGDDQPPVDEGGGDEDTGGDEGGDEDTGGDEGGIPDIFVTICHNEEGNFVNLEVNVNALPAFLLQGDTEGACATDEEGGEDDTTGDEDTGGGDTGGDEDTGGGDTGGDEAPADETPSDETPADNGGSSGGGGGGSTSTSRGPSTNSSIDLASEDEEGGDITLSESDDCEETFDDVDGSYVYYNDVVDGYCNGEISGFDDGYAEFAPNQGVELGHFIKMLVRGSGLIETPHVDGSGVGQYADILEDEGHMDSSMRDRLGEEITTEDAEELTNSVSGGEVVFENTDRGYVLHVLHSIFGN